MSEPLGRVLAREMLDDPEVRRMLRDALREDDPDRLSGGWMSGPQAVQYLGLGSSDALDRLVRDGLPCSQPHGPGGRRYFARAEVDDWLRTNG